jgi:hypothetical protein
MIRRSFPPNRILIPLAACAFVLAAQAEPTSAIEVRAARLDGTSADGKLRAWTDETIAISTESGEQQIATKQLVSLRSQSAAATNPAQNTSASIELIDGSILPIQTIRVTQSQATVTVSLPVGSSKQSLILPTAQLSVVQLRPLEGDLASQWDEIRRQNLTSDVIAVVKKNGKSIDYAEGVIGNITDDKIEFKLEGQTQRIDRSKIAGVVYYRPDRRLKEESHSIIHGRSGLRASAAHVELKEAGLIITSAAGTKLTWPLNDFSGADFSAGKLVYLSDIEPASFKWTPLIGLPSSATIASEYGQLRRDKSAYGGPLSLILRDSDSSLTELLPRSFTKGLALRSRSEVTYRLPTGFRRFVTLAGIDPGASATGSVRLVISGDERVLSETEINGSQQPKPIQFDIADVKRLKILVDYGKNLDTGDWLNLCEARIVK